MSTAELGMGGIIICPESYSYCIKEVMSEVPEEKCGKYGYTSDYFSDTFDQLQMQCVARKCGKECIPNQASFGADGRWTRQTFCCSDKPGFRGEPCNSGMGAFGGTGLVLLVTVFVSVLLILR